MRDFIKMMKNWHFCINYEKLKIYMIDTNVFSVDMFEFCVLDMARFQLELRLLAPKQ